MNYFSCRAFGRYRNYLSGLFKFMEQKRWKRTPFETGNYQYDVSDFGDIYRLPRKSIAKYCPDLKGRNMMPKVSEKGYHRMSFKVDGKSKWFYIHRLVAMLFVENTENKPCVNHKDGNKINNHYSNLEWCTNEENNEHAEKNDLFKRRLKYSEKQFIKENYFKISREELAKKFNVPEIVIYIVGTNRDGKRPKNKLYSKDTGYRKPKIKTPPKCKEVINTETGELLTTMKLAEVLGIKKKYVNRLLSEERKPNNTAYRYTGRYIGT